MLEQDDLIANQESLNRSQKRLEKALTESRELERKTELNNGNLVLEKRKILRGEVTEERMAELRSVLSRQYGHVDSMFGFLGGFGIDTTGSYSSFTSDDALDDLFASCQATEYEVTKLLEKLLEEGKIQVWGITVSSEDGHLLLFFKYLPGKPQNRS